MILNSGLPCSPSGYRCAHFLYNIRFLKSELETFRASFKQEMENA